MRTTWKGIAATRLQSPDGATALIADHGAHLLSWIPANGEESLFMSASTNNGPTDAIRGGVPIIFPQFSVRGSGIRHGFARINAWKLEFVGQHEEWTVARYALTSDEVTVPGWPYSFRLDYEVALRRHQLKLTLQVQNPSDHPWQFNAALHTYLKVDDIHTVSVEGLQNVQYIDQVRNGTNSTQSDARLRIEGEIDRIYLATPGEVNLHEQARKLICAQRGFADTVIWNPGAEKARTISDLSPEDYCSFLCIEAAAIDSPIELLPGMTWKGEQLLSVTSTL